jgi:hypothetical protein
MSDRPFAETSTCQHITSVPPAGLEPAVPASERPQTHSLDRAATGIGLLLYYYYYYYYYVTRPFFLVFLRTNGDPHRCIQVSHCSTLRIMCDVPSIAVVCSESVECFPGMTFKPFFRPFVTIPVAPIITGIIIHFVFHIRYMSVHKLVYFSSFSTSFCVTFLAEGIVTSVSMHF